MLCNSQFIFVIYIFIFAAGRRASSRWKAEKESPLAPICAPRPRAAAAAAAAGSLRFVSSQLCLPLNIVSDSRGTFSEREGSTSELLRPVYVPTFHLHAVYLGKSRKECQPLSFSSLCQTESLV